MGRIQRILSSSQIIILSFLGAILLGTLLLMLPVATKDGQGAPFLDAIFTATSATCVTGLVVQDTATYWSLFGQIVIVAMIQVGGMGVVTMAIAITLFSGRKINLKQRSTMQDAISAPKVGGIVRLTGFIIKMTVIFEFAGAAVMSPVFCQAFGIGRGIWYSLFHSISAFCNAGFDLMGVNGKFSSFTYFASEPVINIVVMLLIIIGGIGFLTWDDIKTNQLHFHRYRMQSKVILMTTALLILLPAGYFFFGEFLSGTVRERALLSLFQSVTTRTAGFNTVDFTCMSQVGVGLVIFLMLIGGSPGSTAGGIKTTTLAVMFANVMSVLGRKEYAHFFGRRIEQDAVRRAATIFVMYLALFLSGAFVICKIENLPLQVCIFETASAIGTVGLTLGITTELGAVSQVILMGLMYFGRVGGLTLIFAATAGKRGNTARLPQEKITVG